MFENIYWIVFGAVVLLGAFWLFMMWFRAPREGRGRGGDK